MSQWWWAMSCGYKGSLLQMLNSPVSFLGKVLSLGRRIVSGGCHPAEQKNDARLCGSPAAVTRRRELDGGGAHVRSFILRRWRLVSWRIVLFPTTACSSINRR
ncbi:unnamed protein product [Spirodela intermedia]|uniref:Uncharacterized protein n=1 Tax=Spirodela intermedia TaxID=51605 RepID=A0A7I8JBS8_SPIIN|nr:unnamed protein product [Spirodela intermedia]CAA6667550.1 unnamed protein product [Spirodela intermedia]